MVSCRGKRGLVYDAGGQELFVLSGREVAFTLSQETERSLISASLNPNRVAGPGQSGARV